MYQNADVLERHSIWLQTDYLTNKYR